MVKPPELFTIAPDDYHAQYIGLTNEGRQFFLTTPFVPAMNGTVGRDFLALYLFDTAGQLLENHIEALPSRTELGLQRFPAGNAVPTDIMAEWQSELPAAQAAVLERQQVILASFGKVCFQQIRIAPFQIVHEGITFGLIANPPQEEGEDWWVTAEPGNYMAFSPPWSSGEYYS